VTPGDNHIPRRAFIATAVLSVPSLSTVQALGSTLARSDDEPGFAYHMAGATESLEHLRRPMRSIDDPESRARAAALANAMTIHLASAVKFADQVHVPERSRDKYADHHERFVNDLRLDLTRSVSATNALSRQLWLGHTAEPDRIFRDVQTNISGILERFINDG